MWPYSIICYPCFFLFLLKCSCITVLDEPLIPILVLQLSALRQELEEAKQAVIESEKKLKFKEETADAAMAARDAAEKSLRLADLRASRLRDKVEELNHQLEEHDNTRETLGTGQSSRPRYVCWPWQWLGLNFVGFHHQPDTEQQGSNEMELSEPFL